VLAGGQSLVPMMNVRLAAPSVVVDSNRIPDFGIRRADDGHVSLGATVRQTTAHANLELQWLVPLRALLTRWSEAGARVHSDSMSGG
jgi:CO/xanthine dehydrogenase FAD-binding subunit